MKNSIHIMQNKQLKVGSIEWCPNSHQVFVNKVQLALTGLEFNLLGLLMKNSPYVVNKNTIAQQVFNGVVTDFDKCICTHISNIRRKIAQQHNLIKIQAIRGKGYLITESLQ